MVRRKRRNSERGGEKESMDKASFSYTQRTHSRFTTLLDDTIVLDSDCNDRKLVYAIKKPEEEEEAKDRSLLTSNINISIHIRRHVTHFIDRQLSWPFLSICVKFPSTKRNRSNKVIALNNFQHLIFIFMRKFKTKTHL